MEIRPHFEYKSKTSQTIYNRKKFGRNEKKNRKTAENVGKYRVRVLSF